MSTGRMSTAGPFGMVPTRAVWDRRLSSGLLRMLAGLTVHANHNRVVIAGQAMLAEELGVSQQAVSKAITRLCDLGYVESVRRGFPARNYYRILFDQPPIIAPRPRSNRAGTPVTTSEVVTARSNMPSTPVTTSEVVPVTTTEVVTAPYREQNDLTDTLAPAAREGGSKEPQDAAGSPPLTPADAGYGWLARDPLYVRAVSLMPAPITAREIGRWGRAIAELRDCGVTPDALTRAARAFQAQWPRARLTITGLSANFSLLGGTPHGIHERSPEEIAARAAADEAASLARRDAKAGLVDLFRIG